MKTKSPESQLATFIARFAPDIGALARAALAKVRARLPGAVELVYDNYNALAIAFGPTDQTSDIVLSITLYPRWVSLFFRRGASLSDPDKLLKGSGTTVRHIVLNHAKDLDKPAIRALIAEALERCATPLDPTKRRRTVIKSVVANQRPRRP